MKEIRIKGLATRYKCFLDDNNKLIIFNEKGQKLGGQYHYNSEQTNYTLYCEDGKRRSFYALRLMYAYTNDISVLDIPKGCIYRTKYGLEHYNKRLIAKRPLKEQSIGEKKKDYIRQLDTHWDMLKRAIFTNDLAEIGEVLMQSKEEVMRRVMYVTGGAKDILEDCFSDSIEYYINRIVSPKYKMNICMPSDALTSYTIKRYRSIKNGKPTSRKYISSRSKGLAIED